MLPGINCTYSDQKEWPNGQNAQMQAERKMRLSEAKQINEANEAQIKP